MLSCGSRGDVPVKSRSCREHDASGGCGLYLDTDPMQLKACCAIVHADAGEWRTRRDKRRARTATRENSRRVRNRQEESASEYFCAHGLCTALDGLLVPRAELEIFFCFAGVAEAPCAAGGRGLPPARADWGRTVDPPSRTRSRPKRSSCRRQLPIESRPLNPKQVEVISSNGMSGSRIFCRTGWLLLLSRRWPGGRWLLPLRRELHPLVHRPPLAGARPAEQHQADW